jgi:hypothetical protein
VVGAGMNAVLDLEKLRREQRQERDAAIRERRGRDLVALAKLRASGVIPPDDLLFRELAGQAMAGAIAAVAPVTESSEWDRKAVFEHLRSGGSREVVPTEAAPFVGDYDASKHIWGG